MKSIAIFALALCIVVISSFSAHAGGLKVYGDGLKVYAVDGTMVGPFKGFTKGGITGGITAYQPVLKAFITVDPWGTVLPTPFTVYFTGNLCTGDAMVMSDSFHISSMFEVTRFIDDRLAIFTPTGIHYPYPITFHSSTQLVYDAKHNAVTVCVPESITIDSPTESQRYLGTVFEYIDRTLLDQAGLPYAHGPVTIEYFDFTR
jgi:hypothetical protein